MGHLYHPGYDPTRAYEGTDTRAFGLLIGAALAMLYPSWTPLRRAARAHRTCSTGRRSSASLVIVVLVWRTNSFSSFLLPDRVRAAGARERCDDRRGRQSGEQDRPAARIRAAADGSACARTGSICGSGRSSCSRAPSSEGFDLPRAALEVAATFAIASLSWRFVEEPIRQGALGRLWRAAPLRRAPGAAPSTRAGARSCCRATAAARSRSSRSVSAACFLRPRPARRAREPPGGATKLPAPLPDEPARPPSGRRSERCRRQRRPRAARSSTSATRPPRARSRRTTSRTRGCACRPSSPTSASARRSRDLRGTLDRRDVRGSAECRDRRAGPHLLRLPRLLDPRPRHQRRRQHQHRFDDRAADADRPA